MDAKRIARRTFPAHAVATGLLLGAVLLFAFAAAWQARWPWLSYVRAFAEAAVIGALADWFAVVALFRRPLRLPIPHTAIIPRNQERIGESLGNFVAEHFLPAEVIRARLAEIDFAALLAGWLARPAHAARLSGQIAALLPGFLHGLDDEKIRLALQERMENLDASSLAGEILAALTAHGRHQWLIDEALRQSAALIAEKEPLIRQKVGDSTGWLWKKLAIDERVFNAIMNAVDGFLREVEEDAGHELRQRFDRALADLIRNLQDAPEYRERIAAVQREIIRNPAFQSYLAGLWDDLRQHLLSGLGAPQSAIHRHLQDALDHLGHSLLADAGLRAALNPWLRETLADFLESHRGRIARLIPDTVRTWDADTLARRLEAQVADDLQFIRINGTLVGGLVGLAIHAVSRLFA